MKLVSLVIFISVFLFSSLSFINYAQAGVCTDVTFLKDGKVVSQNGATTVPAKDSAKYQIKAVVKAKSKTTCKDTYVRVGLIYIDQNNKSSAVKYVVVPTKIPAAGLTKNITFTTSEVQGIYNYSFETYNIKGTDVNTPDGAVNTDGLRITLGSAGKATTGSLEKLEGAAAGLNIDYQANGARDYAGKDWEGALSILNPVKINGGEVTDISQLATKLINWLLLIISLLATIMIVYAGVLLVFNGGNESQATKAKTILTWSIIGLVISLSAFAIVTIIQSLL